jgi:elongation factor G
LSRHNVPTRLLFVNKLDRAGASLRESLLSVLSNQLHPRPVLLSLPIASFSPEVYQNGQPGIEGVVDLVKWQAFKWETLDDSPIASDASVHTGPPEDLLVPNHPLLPALTQARTDLLDLLSFHSPELMDEFLALDAPNPYLAFPADKIIPHLRELTARKEILPVFCGSVLRHIGTKLLMDYIGELLASPIDIENQSQAINKRGFVGLLAWKVGWDKQKGWMTFVRVYAGKPCQLPDYSYLNLSQGR